MVSNIRFQHAKLMYKEACALRPAAVNENIDTDWGIELIQRIDLAKKIRSCDDISCMRLTAVYPYKSSV